MSNNKSVENHLRLILLLALALRVYGLTAFSLSNDELSALTRLQFNSFTQLIQDGVYPDFHPAGTHVFLYIWTSIFGLSEWAVRLPFAIMGAVSVYLVYRVGRSLFSESTGLLASGALAVLAFPLLYSQIARPYSPGLMCSMASVFFLIRFLGYDRDRNGEPVSKGGWLDVVGFVLSVSACMYTHYFSFIFAGLVCLVGLFFLDKTVLWKYLLCGVGIVVLYLPGLDIFLHQLSKGGIGGPDGWLSAPGPDAFGSYLDYVFNDSKLLKFIFFVAFTGVVMVYRGKVAFAKWHVVSLLLFLVPFFVAYFYSVYVNPVFQYSILLFSFPFLLLFLFSFFPKERYGITAKIVLAITVFAGFYSTVFEKKYYHKQHFTEFRSISNDINATLEEYSKDSVTVIANVHAPYYLNYYLKDGFSLDSNSVTRISNEFERDAFNSGVAKSNTPYLIYAYSNIYSPPERDLFIRHFYPNVVELDTFLNSGFRLYSRSNDSRPVQTYPDRQIFANLKSNDYAYRFDTLRQSVKFSKLDEYGPAVNLPIKGSGLAKGQVLIGKAIVSDYDSLSDLHIVITVETKSNKYLYKSNDAILFRCLSKDLCIPVVVELESDLPQDAELKLYVWNKGGRIFNLRSLELEIYRSRPNTFFPPM
ncbi:MAG: glycosyltransferase family 39 protein [Bacteroidota bacterium]